MKIYLDEKELNSEYSSLSLPQLLETVKRDLDSKIVNTIFVNGTEVNEKYLSQSLLDKGDIQSIKFITKSTESLIEETLDEIGKYLPKLRNGIKNTVDLYRNGEINKANKKYQKIIEGINWYLEVTSKILSLLENKNLSNQGNNKLNNLNKIFSEMIEAQQNEDTVLMADILEYEILDYIEEFMDLNEKIKNVHVSN